MPKTTMTICSSCDNPVEVPSSTGLAQDVLCSSCSAQAELEVAAAQDLHAVLYPAVLAWARRWSAAGVSDSGLAFVLDMQSAYWHPDGEEARDTIATVAPQVISEALAKG